MKISLIELFVVFVVAFVVIGPDKLPAYMKKGVKLLKEMKGYTSKLTEEINETITDPLKESAAPIKEIADEITKPLEEVKESMKDII